MSVISTLLSLAVSLWGICRFIVSDSKRRRAFKLKGKAPVRNRWAFAAILLPGLVLLVFDQWSATLMWIGGMPLLGWIATVINPATYAKLSEFLYRQTRIMQATSILAVQYLSSFPARYVPEHLSMRRMHSIRSRKTTAEHSQQVEIEELKARITALEARLHRQETLGDAVLTETVAPELSQNSKPLDAAE